MKEPSGLPDPVFATAHLTSGLAVGLALGLREEGLLVFVGACVLTDWDYGFQLATGRNHRTFLSHCPPVVAAVLVPLALVWPVFWLVLGGAMLHFSLDVWEYGLRLNPFSTKVYGFRLLPGVEHMPFRAYLRTYFTDPRFLAAEVAFGIAAVVEMWAFGVIRD